MFARTVENSRGRVASIANAAFLPSPFVGGFSGQSVWCALRYGVPSALSMDLSYPAGAKTSTGRAAPSVSRSNATTVPSGANAPWTP